MSVYLGRPCFEFPVDWSITPVTEFSYDLGELAIGLGQLPSHRLQTHVVKGIEFSLILDGEDEIEAFDAFVAACMGRLNGFWIRSREAAARITAGIDGSSFKVQDQGWRSYYSAEDTPSLHLELVAPDGSSVRGEIKTVASDNAGAELVTMTADLEIGRASCRERVYSGV